MSRRRPLTSRGWLPLVLMSLVLAGALVVGATRAGPPSPEARARRLAAEIRCPTCRAQSTLESNAPIARTIRGEIERRIAKGQPDGEIIDYLVSRYGENVLLKPKASGAGGLVWGLPLLALALAIGGLALAFPRWRAQSALRSSEEDRELVQQARQRSARVNSAMGVRGEDLDALAGLEEQRVFLLRALADLDEEWMAGELDEAAYASLRDDLTARTAAIMRGIERRRSALPAPAPRRPRRLVVAGAGVAAVALAVGLMAAGAATDRRAGQPSSGSIRESNAAKLNAARDLIRQGEGLRALRYYKEVLESDPANPEALAYRGLVLSMTGRAEAALADLDAAIAADPEYPDPHYFRGMVLSRQLGDDAGGADELRRALALGPAPDMAARIEEALRQTPGAQTGPAVPEPGGS